MQILAQRVSTDFQHPQDKRRFGKLLEVKFFNSLPIDFSDNDKIILNIHSDVTAVPFLKSQGAFIVFDYCDMIHLRNPVSFLIMTLLWWIKGKISYPISRRRFKNILSLVDILVVGSLPQKDICSMFRDKKIEIIEDYFPEILEQGDLTFENEKHGILWEGLAGGNLRIIYKCFRIAKKANLDLSIITDERYPLFSGLVKVPMIHILNLISKLTRNQWYSFYEWNIVNLKDVSDKCEYIVIPLNHRNKLELYKPCNKAALAIRLGLKPILSSTPDYELLSNTICAEGGICFNHIIEAVNLTHTYPQYDYNALNEYLINRNKQNLKSKWEKTLSLD